MVTNDIQIVSNILELSIASGLNALLVGLPGYGKTAVLVDAARKLFPEQWAALELSPAASPEIVWGRIRPDAVVRGDANYLDKTGTADDPNAELVILDEFSRANAAVLDALLHLTEPRFGQRQRLFWGTANWTTRDDRNNALRSRFAIVKFMAKDYDPAEILFGQPEYVGRGIEALKEASLAVNPPTPEEWEWASGVVSQIDAAAKEAGLATSPRLVVQWAQAVVAANRLWNDDPDTMAAAVGHVYPATEEREYSAFAAIAFGVLADEEAAYAREIVSKMRERVSRMTVAEMLAELPTEIKEAQKAVRGFRNQALAERTVGEIKKIAKSALRQAQTKR